MGIFSIFSRILGGQSDLDKTRADAAEKLRAFLQNQIDILSREEQSIHFNEITVGYVSHLLMFITKKPVILSDVNLAMNTVFEGESNRPMIENAIAIFQGDIESQDKLAALFPIVKKEYEAGLGEFLVRHTRKAHKEIEALFLDEDFDPTKVASWSAKDLA